MAASPVNLRQWFAQSSAEAPECLVLDGGVSTCLETDLKRKGETFSHRELWSSSLLLTKEGCDAIRDCHTCFFEAGADICSTVTYQCHYQLYNNSRNPIVDEETMTRMLKTGVMLAKAAALTKSGQKKRYVVASIGCYGAALADGSEYTGKYGRILTKTQISEFHRRKLAVLLDQSPDAIAFETVPCVLECEAIISLIREVSRRQSALWLSLSCQGGAFLNDGSTLEEALNKIRDADPNAEYVDAVGINCCDVVHVPSLLTILTTHMAKKGPRRGIVVYPNTGETWDAEGSDWREGTGCTIPQKFADRMVEAFQLVRSTWQNESVNKESLPRVVIGGCCRTSPGTIAAIRNALDKLQKR